MAYDPEYHRNYYQKHKARIDERNRKWAKQNPERVKASNSTRLARYRASGAAKAATKRWEARNRERVLWRAARHRARKLGLEFSISVNDICIPSTCPLLGIPINRDTRGRMQPNSPSLDRRHPTKGYTKDNVRVISWQANRLKSDASREELMILALNIGPYLDG